MPHALPALVLIDRPSRGYAVVTLNRPAKLNALSRQLVDELGRALEQLAVDPDLRALVLTGAGKAFCAGLDLGEVGADAGFGLAQIRPLSEFPHPVIGAINGAAVTGGLEFALQCDFRIASRSEEHTSELQSLMRISYAVFCLKKKTNN